jgi:hypothetical protein
MEVWFMKRNSSILWGSFFIILGIIFLVDRFYNFGLLDMSRFWPLFILVPGLMFEAGYFFSRKDPGLLVPGGILTTIGISFLINTLVGWGTFKYTMPLFPLSVSVGLFQLYLFGERQRGLLIPVFILAGISLFLLALIGFNNYFEIFFIPAVLIILGLVIIFNGGRKNKGDDR